MFELLEKKDKRTRLEKEIDHVFAQLSKYDPTTPEYEAISKNLETLYRAYKDQPKRFVTLDRVLAIAFPLMEIGVIILFEKTDILNMKALQRVSRNKIG